jgi:hypothetical protein
MCQLAGAAHADRPVHGSAGAGATLLLTGDGGDRARFEIELDVEPASRFGGLVAWFDEHHHGLLLASVMYEAGAARPRLVVDLHGDIGADLDQTAPAIGGGVRTTLMVWGPLGVGLDTGAYVVVDGVDATRLVLGSSASVVVRW